MRSYMQLLKLAEQLTTVLHKKKEACPYEYKSIL